MTDIIDIANDAAQDDIDRILSHAVKKFDLPSLSECIDYGDDIPVPRQRLGGVTRCIDCQTVFEKR